MTVGGVHAVTHFRLDTEKECYEHPGRYKKHDNGAVTSHSKSHSKKLQSYFRVRCGWTGHTRQRQWFSGQKTVLSAYAGSWGAWNATAVVQTQRYAIPPTRGQSRVLMRVEKILQVTKVVLRMPSQVRKISERTIVLRSKTSTDNGGKEIEK